MHPLATLASTLITITLIVTVYYFWQCCLWPFRACRRCSGAGKFRGPFGGIRLCPRCTGTGLRLRLGRRVWNAASRLYRVQRRQNTTARPADRTRR